ncbi:MAG TPA: hypothetical protein VK249_07550 [Anaerolineales bacterium]|nr:hypothetical protein [Anaerolineales bacterium]
MSTLQGEPHPPTFRSIFAGIAIVALLFFAFINLSVVVKYTGAVLAFIPSKIGLMQVVKRAEVIPVDLSTSPTPVTFTKPGKYIFYTDNYDLLVINDAVIEAGSKPWLKISSDNGASVPIHLINRGMAFYDPIAAKGRPIGAFTVETPGNYSITHPSRSAIASIVPDYISGQERFITFIFIAEFVILVIAIRDIGKSVRSRKSKTRE